MKPQATRQTGRIEATATCVLALVHRCLPPPLTTNSYRNWSCTLVPGVRPWLSETRIKSGPAAIFIGTSLFRGPRPTDIGRANFRPTALTEYPPLSKQRLISSSSHGLPCQSQHKVEIWLIGLSRSNHEGLPPNQSTVFLSSNHLSSSPEPRTSGCWLQVDEPYCHSTIRQYHHKPLRGQFQENPLSKVHVEPVNMIPVFASWNQIANQPERSAHFRKVTSRNDWYTLLGIIVNPEDYRRSFHSSLKPFRRFVPMIPSQVRSSIRSVKAR